MTNTNIVTPVGVASWPWLDKPDTRFNPDGVYTVGLKLRGAEAEALKRQIDAVNEEAYQKLCKENPKKTIRKSPNVPYQDCKDDTGALTGETEFKFKKPATVKDKNTGNKVSVKPLIVDAKKNPLKDLSIWGGSKLRIAGYIKPYYTAALGAGVSLRLNGVQVIELVQGSGGNHAEFTEMDGFVADPSDGTPGELNSDFAAPTAEKETGNGMAAKASEL